MSHPFHVINEPTHAVKTLGAIDHEQGSKASPFLASERSAPIDTGLSDLNTAAKADLGSHLPQLSNRS